MRCLVACLLACSMLSGVDEAVEPAPAPILLLSYQAFAGRGVNGSETVGTDLADEHVGGHRVVHVSLPVVWGEPEAQVPGLIAEHQPVLVLGLGEGFPNRIAVEQRAVNRRDYPDERGDAPPAQQVDPAGPASHASRWRFDPAAFTDHGIAVVASSDAGTYLCNNLLYTSLASDCPIVGFVHLPPQGTLPADAYRSLCSPVIRKLITTNLPASP